MRQATLTLPARKASQEDHVFDVLVRELLQGRYPVGSRLPSERELALQYGTSRSTLREALRRIEALGLVRARRGSGLVVRDLMRDGTIGLLPVWLRAGAPGAAPDVVLRYLMRLRRILVAQCLQMAARSRQQDALGIARERLAQAWEKRADRDAFLRADFELMHALARATGFAPAAWLLNTIESVYVEVAGSLAEQLPAARDYLRVHTDAIDALAAGDGDRAVELLDAYFERHDTRLYRALGMA